jgi:hypothetical protein
MTAGAPPPRGIMALVKLGVPRAALAIPICIALTMGACVNFERQSTLSPLVPPRHLLAEAEEQHLDTGKRPGEVLAVAKIALEQLSSGTQPDPVGTPVRALPKAVIAAVTPKNDPRKFRPPNSIYGLSQKNPLLLALEKLPIEAPHNSIIGDRGRGDPPKSSDGVVPYWSSHLDTAQSELIVPTDHGAMNHPKAFEEVRHVLLQRLRGDKSRRTTRTDWQNRTRLQAFSPQVEFAATNP